MTQGSPQNQNVIFEWVTPTPSTDSYDTSHSFSVWGQGDGVYYESTTPNGVPGHASGAHKATSDRYVWVALEGC